MPIAVPDSIIASEARFNDWRARLMAAQEALAALRDDVPGFPGYGLARPCPCALDTFRGWLDAEISETDRALRGLDAMKDGARLAALNHSCASRVPAGEAG